MAQTWPWVNRFIVLFFRSLARARVSRADRLEPSSVSSSHKNQIRRRAHDVQSASHCFFVGHCRSRGLIADRSCSREGPGPKAPHPFRIIGEKACAVVRMVDEDPEGRRARDEPRAQLGPLGQPVRAASGSCARAMTVGGYASGPARWPAPCSASNSPQRSPACRARPGLLASNDEA